MVVAIPALRMMSGSRPDVEESRKERRRSISESKELTEVPWRGE
jgi:hypothetical protein